MAVVGVVLEWCAGVLWGEVAMFNCGGDVVGGGAEYGEAVGVLVVVVGVGLSFGSEFGFAVVYC